MARLLGGLFLAGVWFVSSAFLILPVAFMQNGLLLTGALLFVLACLVAAINTYVKRRDSTAYTFAAVPGLAFAIWGAVDELLAKL
jgi:hypothetical protein